MQYGMQQTPEVKIGHLVLIVQPTPWRKATAFVEIIGRVEKINGTILSLRYTTGIKRTVKTNGQVAHTTGVILSPYDVECKDAVIINITPNLF